MDPDPKTPMHWPPCPVCRGDMQLDGSRPIESHVECSGCYSIIGFVRLKGALQAYVVKHVYRRVAELIPESIARELHVCPLPTINQRLWVACVDPGDDALRKKLQSLSGREIRLVQMEPRLIPMMIEWTYRMQESEPRR